MLKVFMEKSADGPNVKLSDGRLMPLEGLVRDYERLLEESPKKEVIADAKAKNAKTEKKITEKLEVGKWFRIDRNVIEENKDEIFRKCIEIGVDGEGLWERFKHSNEIANQNPEQYSRVIETYIFKHNWEYKFVQELRDMCAKVGDGMCDEIICDLELQMRICNGESVYDLSQGNDELPFRRVIKLRNGGTGYLGGGYDDFCPPAVIRKYLFYPKEKFFGLVPYAFRLVYSEQ